MANADWRAINRAYWDEAVGVHLGARGYNLAPLRAGRGRLNAIEEAELGDVAGKRVLHLQCHFGHDSLMLAQRGASVVGLDFSPVAIAAGEKLASEVGLADRVRFVRADLYDAVTIIAEPGAFDLVYVTWGALQWLPDIRRWAEIVASFLHPGGALYLAEGHPAALVFDDLTATPDGRPGFYAPYFATEPLVMQEAHDYIDETATQQNATTCTWIHPLGSVVSALLESGLRLDWLHEHDAVTWRMFKTLTRGEDRLWRWPDKPWLPLAYSLRVSRPAA